MTLLIRFRPEAEEDLRLAIAWYEEQREGLGDELTDVGKTIERIERLPDVGARQRILRSLPS